MVKVTFSKAALVALMCSTLPGVPARGPDR